MAPPVRSRCAAQLVEGLAAAHAHVHLAQGDAEFVRPGALVLLRDPVQCLAEAEARADHDREDVEEVGQRAVDDVRRLRIAARCRPPSRTRRRRTVRTATMRLPLASGRRRPPTPPRRRRRRGGPRSGRWSGRPGCPPCRSCGGTCVDPLGPIRRRTEGRVAHAQAVDARADRAGAGGADLQGQRQVAGQLWRPPGTCGCPAKMPQTRGPSPVRAAVPCRRPPSGF